MPPRKAGAVCSPEATSAVKFTAVMDPGVYAIYVANRENTLLFLNDAYSLTAFVYGTRIGCSKVTEGRPITRCEKNFDDLPLDITCILVLNTNSTTTSNGSVAYDFSKKQSMSAGMIALIAAVSVLGVGICILAAILIRRRFPRPPVASQLDSTQINPNLSRAEDAKAGEKRESVPPVYTVAPNQLGQRNLVPPSNITNNTGVDQEAAFTQGNVLYPVGPYYGQGYDIMHNAAPSPSQEYPVPPMQSVIPQPPIFRDMSASSPSQEYIMRQAQASVIPQPPNFNDESVPMQEYVPIRDSHSETPLDSPNLKYVRQSNV